MDRPVNEGGERVTPSNLLDYRRSHELQGPCCLCASLSPDESAYTEASIFLAKSGPSAGGYVAACATGQCRYWGNYKFPLMIVYISLTGPPTLTVGLEHLYNQRGLLVKRYPLLGEIPNTGTTPIQLTCF
jgi:hypothetical protein